MLLTMIDFSLFCPPFYQIRINGVKSYINELNDPVRLTLGPRKLIVSPTETQAFNGHPGSPHGMRNDFMMGDQDTHLVHTVDKLEPNAVIDIEVRPVYEAANGRQMGEAEALWEQTSCRTKMHRKSMLLAVNFGKARRLLTAVTYIMPDKGTNKNLQS